MRLSTNFVLREFVRSEYAQRHGIDMTPSAEVVDNLRELCIEVLEPLRWFLGDRGIMVLSGYRPPVVNLGVGGAEKSAHLEGRAADILVMGLTPLSVYQGVRELMAEDSEFKFDQCILEYGEWTHISLPLDPDRPRRELLSKMHRNGQAITSSGLQ